MVCMLQMCTHPSKEDGERLASCSTRWPIDIEDVSGGDGCCLVGKKWGVARFGAADEDGGERVEMVEMLERGGVADTNTLEEVSSCGGSAQDSFVLPTTHCATLRRSLPDCKNSYRCVHTPAFVNESAIL